MQIKPTTLAKLTLAKELAMDVINPDARADMLRHFRDAAGAQADLVDAQHEAGLLSTDEAVKLMADWIFLMLTLSVELSEL